MGVLPTNKTVGFNNKTREATRGTLRWPSAFLTTTKPSWGDPN